MKNLSGINSSDGYLNGLDVTGDGTISGTLTVDNTIQGGAIVSDTNFLASDTTDQYKVSSTNFDLKANVTNPVFRLKNSSGVTSNSTLQTAIITATTIGATTGTFTGTLTSGGTLYVADATNTTSSFNVVRFNNAGQSFDGIIFRNGPLRVTDGGANTMTIRNDAGDVRLQAVGAIGFTVTSTGTTHNTSLDTQGLTTTTLGVSSTSSFTGTATFGATSHSGQLSISDKIVSTNTTNASVSLNGAIYTDGGIKSAKTVVANQGVQIPYGQALKSDNNHSIQTKMMDAQFNLAGGVINDGLYLYTPGSTAGSASTSFVLGLSESEAKFPQDVAIAGDLTVTGSITGGSISYATTSTGTMAVTNGTGTTLTVSSTDANSATFAGGINVAGNVVVGGTLTAGTIAYASTTTGTLAISDTNNTTLTSATTKNSTSATNAGSVFQGGVGIVKDLHVGGECHIGQGYPINGTRNFTVYNTSTNPSAKLDLNFTNNTGTANITLTGSGAGEPNAMYVDNPMSVIRVRSGGTSGIAIDSANLYSNLMLKVLDTTDSTSTSTGSTIIDGGLAVKRKSYWGDDMHPTKKVIIEDTTDSTSAPNTGAFQCVGGGSFTKNLYVGGTVDVGANLGFRTAVSSGSDLTNPAFILNNVTDPVSANSHTFLQTNLSSGKTAVLALGNALSLRNSATLSYKYDTLDSNKEIQLNFYAGEGIGITTSGLSINGGAAFQYTEGTFTLSFTGGHGSVTTNTCSYVKIGKQVTCSIYVKFNITGGGPFTVYIGSLFPVGTPATYPAFNLSADECYLEGFAKPYFMEYDVSGSATFGIPVYAVRGYNNAFWYANDANDQIIKGTYTYLTT